RHECGEEDERAHRPRGGDERNRDPAERVADQHDVFEPLAGCLDDLRVPGRAGADVVAGKIDRDRLRAARLELGHDAVPAPGAAPSTTSACMPRRTIPSCSCGCEWSGTVAPGANSITFSIAPEPKSGRPLTPAASSKAFTESKWTNCGSTAVDYRSAGDGSRR